MIKVQLKRSLIRLKQGQKTALRCLGLRKIHQTKTLPDSPCVRGQIKKVLNLVEIKNQEAKNKKDL